MPVAAGDLTGLRKQMNALRPPGHTRIHMTGVGTKLAPKIVSEVARLEASSRIHLMSSKKVNERQAATSRWPPQFAIWLKRR
ncbi:hypothetical protein W59_03866 [Rhodococcus opacus RKJ300 = JCM 13270]|uniref:Uncharacterized protein n=2 Tax=Rhodococcus opacus TaxID=37919 RepID=I0WYB3_RHOOP|nr:hypothetical protein W59_03866 [Rhodococcus opacus RKJ300 = JCM 13270]